MIQHLFFFTLVTALSASPSFASSNFRIVCEQDSTYVKEDLDFLVLELNQPKPMSAEKLEGLFRNGGLKGEYRLTRYVGVKRKTPDQDLIELSRRLVRTQFRMDPLVAEGYINLSSVHLNFEDPSKKAGDHERFLRFNSYFPSIPNEKDVIGHLEFSNRTFNRSFAFGGTNGLDRHYNCSHPEFYEVSSHAPVESSDDAGDSSGSTSVD